MKDKYFPLSLLIALLLFPSLNYAQQQEQKFLNFTNADSSKEKPVQYRRGIELNENFQSYEEKYYGKDLNKEKRRFFPLQSTGVWTELNPKVPRVDYLGIQFVNKDTGWAVGDLGALIKSTDGGSSWTISETNTTTPILKVRSFNGEVVIASGFGGQILRSTDSGETFTQVTSGVTGDLWGLQMLNDTLGWACGNANSLTKTTNGGQTWQRIFTPGYTSDYWWIDFLDESYGFIAANGKVLRTIDGGLNWEIIQAGDSQPLFSIDIIDSLHIAAAGYGGTGYAAKNIYSSDGGYTWINGQQTTTHEINCIKYVNTDTGYIVMSEIGIYKTTNRGQNWNFIPAIEGVGEYELSLLPENVGYSVGTILKIYKTENGYDYWKRLIINDNFSDVFFVSEQKGFVISGSFYKTTNSGTMWQKVPGTPGGSDIVFVDSLIGFIAGPTIYKSTNGGDSWYPANVSVTTGPVVKIFFINATTGWAVTIYSSVQEVYILKTIDGGENWFEQFTALSFPSFTSIHFFDSLYGWISCVGGHPFKTTNGGQNWIEQTNINIGQSRDIYFIDSVNGFIVESNKLYKSTDAGFTWVLNPDVTGFSIAAKFSYYGQNFIFVTGYTTYRTTNAGEDWIEFDALNGLRINGLNLLNEGLGYAAGALGLVLKYYDSTYVPVELISFQGEAINNKVTLSWLTASEINNKGFYIQKSFDKEVWFGLGFVEGKGTTTEKNYYSFIDNKVTSGFQYYRLKQIDFDGDFEYSQVVEVVIGLPTEYSLLQNFPNPFNPTTKIKYTIPSVTLRQAQSDIHVTLKVYDMLGNEVATLVNEEKQPGIYEVEFDGKNFSSGVYICQLRTVNYLKTIKMLLLK